MDQDAIERARQRLAEAAEGRTDAAGVEAALERAKQGLEDLAAAAAELEATLPAKVGEAVKEGVASEARPVGRQLAEVRGLMNQLIRRIEGLETDLLGERHARVDDLALLVDLVSSGWKGVDTRLGRIEAVVARLEQSLQENRGAIVYRMEDRRPDAATS
jgi:chromosome segregation ATPase